MRSSSRICAGLYVLVAAAALEAVAAEKSATIVLKAKPDARVALQDEISGRLLAEGVPVVLVRAAEDKEWWIQPDVELQDKGEFKAKVRFGNANTPAGTQFSVIVLLTRTPAEVAMFQQKESLAALPRELPASDEMIVKLDRANAASSAPTASATVTPGVIASPEPNGRVETKHPVSGKAGDAFPVVLVRSAEPGDLWWVQEAPARDSDGMFKTVARFGNDKTLAGAEFQLVVLLLPTAKEAESFVIGDSFQALPPRVRQSETISVKVQRTAPSAKE